MDLGSVVIGITLGAALLLLIGHSFIDSFFKHKEELISKLQNERGEV